MSAWTDLRQGIRLAAKNPAFTATAVSVLALGIAANMLVFTLVNGILFRELPFDAPNRIVAITVFNRDNARNPVSSASYPDLRDWNQMARTFEGIAGADERTMNVSDETRPAERFRGAFVSAAAFSLLGRRPLLGRDFRADDDREGAAPVVILGHAVWQRRYQGDSAIVGRTIRVNGVPSTVIGVMPEDFGFPQVSSLWQPLVLVSQETRTDRRVRNIDTFGRLRPGVSLDQASADLESVMAALAARHPESNRNLEPRLRAFRSGLGGPVYPMMAALSGTVAFVLLIACGNVANLLLSRAADRAREVSLRMSLGASRWQIVRQLLGEGLVLAAIAGVLALGLSFLGIKAFWSVAADTDPPFWLQFPFDATVFGYLAAVCLGTTIVFGLLPALHTSRTSLVELLNDAGRGATGLRGRRWSGILVGGQIALTLVLLAGAGATVRGIVASSTVEAGVATAGLLRLRLDLPAPKYDQPEQRRVFYAQLDERLASMDLEAAIADAVPLGGGAPRELRLSGAEDPSREGPTVSMVTIGPRFFETVGSGLRGRDFAAGDGEPGRGAAIVNQRFAALHFGGTDPLGQRIRLAAPAFPGVTDTTTAEWMTIVGIAQNVQHRPLPDGGFAPVVYVPYQANTVSNTNIVVRFTGDLAPAADAVRAQMRALDPDVPLFDVRTVDDLAYFQRWDQRVFGSMFAIFGAIALLMAAVGLYAVTAYSVSQRTREFGVHMALGASAAHVRWLVTRRALPQVVIGLTLGVLGTVAITRIIPAILSVSQAGDPRVLGGVVLGVVLVAAAACLLPARRATRIDPVAALRAD
jgi:putative ABC transport system permease protein